MGGATAAPAPPGGKETESSGTGRVRAGALLLRGPLVLERGGQALCQRCYAPVTTGAVQPPALNGVLAPESCDAPQRNQWAERWRMLGRSLAPGIPEREGEGMQIIGILALYEEAKTEQIMCQARQLS